MEGKNSEIIKRRSQLSPAKQAILEKRLRGENNSNNQKIAIPRRTQQSPVALSPPQQRLWFLQQLEPQSSAYNEFACIQLKGTLNFAILEKSYNEIIKRHESLRTSFETLDEQPVQVIHPSVSVKLPVVNLGNLPQALQHAEVERLTAEIAQKPFDLASSPLLRVMLLQTGEQEYLLLLVAHHIVCDGWSMQVLNQELAVIYEAFSAEKSSPLSELPIQYADYSIWHHQSLQGEREKTQLSYWKQQLANAPTTLSLPTDRQRPPLQSFKGAVRHFQLSSRLTDMLRSLSKEQGVTLFMTLLAAFKAQLYRYTDQEDICIGSPIANRNHADVEELIGFFVNTLVFRTDLSGNPSFLELLKRVREVCVGAYAHANLPFERLVEELHPERNLSHNPLFQVMFALQEDNDKDLVLPNLTLKWLQNHSGRALFDLTLNVVDAKSELWGYWEYNIDLFDASTVERMVGHFTNLLEDVVSQPEKRLSDLPLLTEPERQTLLFNWNNTVADYPQDKCIHELFELQVEKTPDAIAVVFENQQLSYRELNRRANQLAHYLQKLGVKPEVLVGICVERSLDMVIGLLAILKAGGAYVPLDPFYPKERLAFMLEDTQVSVLLTQQQLVEQLPEHKARVVCLDEDCKDIAHASQENLSSGVTTDNLAYVIYTSGSTGKPKGICLAQRSLMNLLQWHFSSLCKGARTLQFASLSFDASFHEIFATWGTGGTLFILSENLRMDAVGLGRFVSDQAIEKVILPVVVLQLLAESVGEQGIAPLHIGLLNTLREIITTGEQLQITQPIVKLFKSLKHCSLHNHYGPSETHVVTALSLGKNSDEWSFYPPIGRPITNTQIYIVDRQFNIVPLGVTGELYIGGVSLAQGYLNRPDLTAEKFIPNPFSEKPGARLYKTGDLARYLPNGNIEYLGRIDHQVKIRGFRIELGEIEAALSQHPAVREVVVLDQDQKDEAGNKRLVAYVVSDQKSTSISSELRYFLDEKLPSYMVPSAFVFLRALPLTSNGKVDRQALPLPDLTRPELERTFVAPRTAAEEIVVEIWRQVLDIEKVGIHDNFFELGGHSLITTQVISRIRQVFQIELPIRSLFKSPTVEGLVDAIAQIWGTYEVVEEIAWTWKELEQISVNDVKTMLLREKNEIEG